MFFVDKSKKKLAIKSNKQKVKKKVEWDYSAKPYVEWRTKVFKRDLYKCRVCGKNTYIEAHHIKMKSKFPRLAYQVSNGITLCKHHHKVVTGYEDKWIVFFKKILAKKNYNYEQIMVEFKTWVLKLMS